MVFWPPTNGIWSPLPMVYRHSYPLYIDTLTHCISTPTHGILTTYPWYKDPLTYGILTPYQWYMEPHTHGISTLYPWYFDPPTNGILTLPTHDILIPLSMVFWPLAYLLIRNEGGKNTMGVQFTIQGGQNTMKPVLSSFMTYHRICNQIKTTSTTNGAGTTYFSRATEFSPGF